MGRTKPACDPVNRELPENLLVDRLPELKLLGLNLLALVVVGGGLGVVVGLSVFLNLDLVLSGVLGGDVVESRNLDFERVLDLVRGFNLEDGCVGVGSGTSEKAACLLKFVCCLEEDCIDDLAELLES